MPHFEFLGELRGSFFAFFAVKSFDFRLKQEPMTAKLGKEGLGVREEIQSEVLPARVPVFAIRRIVVS